MRQLLQLTVSYLQSGVKAAACPLGRFYDQMARFPVGGDRVVLSGIHLDNGQGLQPARCLLDLLKSLNQDFSLIDCDFSSLETLEWSADLLQPPGVLVHRLSSFHIPLQTQTRNPQRMGRTYTPRAVWPN